ncbi:F-box domain-containing protein [Mycena sanguinolenta]|uniref:F-box domain-containing protein n=1 Tax=Mycena sanguinolenta TaxID=230812 RepID=A0A8H6XNQ1_9AGAR|nr:F-box domain-containing protein [Mycena sanguinolenta]
MVAQCSECGAFVVSNPRGFDLNDITPRTLARISQLLTSNEPPQEPELKVLRSVASNTAARLTCLDADISRLQNQLKQLQDERAALAEYHAQNTTILSPLRRIPSEILGEIFYWSLPFNPTPNMKDAPWVLTHVSRRWRAVAILNASLWSKIYLDFNTVTKYSSAMVRTQTERARVLKISFHGSSMHDSHPQIDTLRVLLERSFIWEELRLDLTATLVPLMTVYRGRFTVLRRVWVEWDGSESQAAVQSLNFLRMAVALTDITVFSQYRFLPTLLPVHHQLTRYDFDAPWATHYELLKSLPNLHEVRITRDFDLTLPWPQPGEPIRLLHLRCLYVSDPAILNYLAAPVLERLAIMDNDGIATSSHLDPFLTRSSCSVCRLCIAGLPDVQSTTAVLQQQHSITELAIMVKDVGDDDEDTERDVLTAFLTHFTTSNSTGILPHISRLDFGCENADTIPYSLYLNMLASRWNAHYCALKAAELLLLNAGIVPDPQSLAKIDILRKEGMQLSYLSGNEAEDRADQWLHVPSWAPTWAR